MPDHAPTPRDTLPATNCGDPMSDYIWLNNCRHNLDTGITISAGYGEVCIAHDTPSRVLRAPQSEVATMLRSDCATVVLRDAGPLEQITAARELLEATLDQIRRDGWVNGVQEEAVRIIQTLGELTVGEDGPSLAGRRS